MTPVFAFGENIKFIRATLLGLIVISCSQSHLKKENVIPATSTFTKKSSCPFSSVDQFLEEFLTNQEAQLRYTQFPLKRSHLEPAGEDNKTINELVSKDRIVLPIIEDMRDASIKDDYNVTLTKIGENRWRYWIIKKESDSVDLRFIIVKKDCYQLVEIEDLSL